eukprot:11790523-Heterocapsa_arctica.AAC.1
MEQRSGSSREAGSRPTRETLDWIRNQEWRERYHNFGALYYQPYGWPDEYFRGNYLVCPPKVEGSDLDIFRDMVGRLHKFHGLDFAYIGKNRYIGAKAHWEPSPFPVREAGWKGKQKGTADRNESAKQGGVEEKKREETKAQGPAKDWFTNS